MTSRTEVHTLIYTPSCFPILQPVLHYLKKHCPDCALSVTALWDPSSVAQTLGPEVSVYANAEGIASFLGGLPRRRLLLLIADFNHPAHRIGYQAVCVARKQKIPSLSIQHGIMGVDHQSGVIKGYYATFSSDKMAVWGAWFAEILRRSGVSPERLVVTGNPRFDCIPDLRKEREIRPRVRNFFGVAPQDKLVVLAMAAHMYTTIPELRWPKEKVLALITEIIKGIVSGGRVKLVVRPHPAEYPNGTAGWYQEAAEKIGVKIQLNHPGASDQPPLYHLLQAADLVVTQYSSTGLESVLLGTPALSVFTPENHYVSMAPYVDQRGYYQVTATLETMAQTVSSKVSEILCHSETRKLPSQEFVKDFAYQLDGRACERISTVINEMVSGGRAECQAQEI